MFVKLAVLVCCLAATSAQKWHGPLAGGEPASRYPAGIDPQACPNFPNCANPAVALTRAGHAGGAGAGWNGGNNGGWNGGNNGGGWNGGNDGGWNGGNNGGWNGGHNGGGGWNGGNDGQWNNGNNGGWNNGNDGGWNGGDNGGQWNGGHNGGWNQNALDAGEYTGDGDYRGEGLAESGAYGDNGHNNGGWNGGNQGYNNAAAGQGAGASIPAGVDGHSCPNYPYCHI